MRQLLHHLQLSARPASPAALFCTCMLLAGCGTVPPATQRVDIPVYTPCVTAAPVRPVFKFDKLGLDASGGEKTLALAIDWPLGRKYELELEALLAGCL